MLAAAVLVQEISVKILSRHVKMYLAYTNVLVTLDIIIVLDNVLTVSFYTPAPKDGIILVYI